MDVLMEQRSPEKLVYRMAVKVSVPLEFADYGAVLLVARCTPSKWDRRQVSKPGNATKFAALSVIE